MVEAVPACAKAPTNLFNSNQNKRKRAGVGRGSLPNDDEEIRRIQHKMGHRTSRRMIELGP